MASAEALGKPGRPARESFRAGPLGKSGGKKKQEKTEKGGMKMAGKIFYRERLKIGVKEKKPRFKLVAVAGVDITFYGDHLRKRELEEIAEAVGAELVLLKVQKKDKDEEVEVKD
jgi:hypothetical protein